MDNEHYDLVVLRVRIIEAIVITTLTFASPIILAVLVTR